MLIRRLASSAVVASSAAVAYYYRPLGDDGKETYRKEKLFTSTYELSERSPQSNDVQMGPISSILYQLAQHVVVFSCTTTTRMFLYLGGRFHVKEDEHYSHFVSTVRQRVPGVPLITVSNMSHNVPDSILTLTHSIVLCTSGRQPPQYAG